MQVFDYYVDGFCFIFAEFYIIYLFLCPVIFVYQEKMDIKGKILKSTFKSVCVFCGSNTGKRACYIDAAIGFFLWFSNGHHNWHIGCKSYQL